MDSFKLFLTVFLALAVFLGADGLKCHQCTSQVDAECNDPMWFEPGKEGGVRKIKTEKFLKECPSDKPYTICRKIFQHVRGDERVIRSCGYVEHKNECYQTVLEEYNTLVCQCRTDGCNGARTIDFSLGLTILAASVAAYMAY